MIGAWLFARWARTVRLTDEQIKALLSMYEQKVVMLESAAMREARSEQSASSLDHKIHELRMAQNRVAKLNKALAKRDGRQDGELSLVKGENDE